MATEYLLPSLCLEMTDVLWTLGKEGNEAGRHCCILRHHLDLHFQFITLDTPSYLLILEFRE